MAKSLPHNLIEGRRDWAVLSAYERFEAFVALILTLLIAAVIVTCGASLTVWWILSCSEVSTRWSTACFKRSSGRS
jgi:uncharacterized MAPEG superfamily protein